MNKKPTKNEIKEFKELYSQEVGKDISSQEAVVIITGLANLFRIAYEPNKDKYKNDQPIKQREQ